jgi:hypothetical protein
VRGTEGVGTDQRRSNRTVWGDFRCDIRVSSF